MIELLFEHLCNRRGLMIISNFLQWIISCHFLFQTCTVVPTTEQKERHHTDDKLLNFVLTGFPESKDNPG